MLSRSASLPRPAGRHLSCSWPSTRKPTRPSDSATIARKACGGGDCPPYPPGSMLGAGARSPPRLEFEGVRRAGLSHAKVAKPAYAVLNTAVWQGDAAPPFDPQLLAPLPGQRWAGARPPNPVAGAPPTDTIASWPPPASTPDGTRRLAQRGCGGRWRHGREQWTRRHGHGPERSRQAGRP